VSGVRVEADFFVVSARRREHAECVGVNDLIVAVRPTQRHDAGVERGDPTP